MAELNTTSDDMTQQATMDDIALALRERVKELECLYTISSLRERHANSPELFLQGVVNCLPRTWQFPEFASARIKYGNTSYVTDRFGEGPWRMSADVTEQSKVVGHVAVFYSQGVPAKANGPFLREEHALLRVIAERVGHSLAHMRTSTELAEAHRTLRAQHQILQERNITLRSVLATLEEEKRDIRLAILSNIQKIIMPIVFELELAVTGRQRSYVTLLRQSLQEIASPFYTTLARDHVELSPVEVAISAMIRNGMSTKEIAQLRCISPATVRRHRENIRQKLGLRNRRANLVTFLQNEGKETPAESRAERDAVSAETAQTEPLEFGE
jgi:DNA-binding NarL/FixJ family response regulator